MNKIELIRSLKAMQTQALQQELALFGILPRASNLDEGEEVGLDLTSKVRSAQVSVRQHIGELEELIEAVTVHATRFGK